MIFESTFNTQSASRDGEYIQAMSAGPHASLARLRIAARKLAAGPLEGRYTSLAVSGSIFSANAMRGQGAAPLLRCASAPPRRNRLPVFRGRLRKGPYFAAETSVTVDDGIQGAADFAGLFSAGRLAAISWRLLQRPGSKGGTLDGRLA